MLVFGIIGYTLRKLGFEPAPLILAFILGPMVEDKLRHSLLIFNGDLSIFFRRPIALAFIITALLLIFLQFLPWFRKGKSSALKE